MQYKNLSTWADQQHTAVMKRWFTNTIVESHMLWRFLGPINLAVYMQLLCRLTIGFTVLKPTWRNNGVRFDGKVGILVGCYEQTVWLVEITARLNQLHPVEFFIKSDHHSSHLHRPQTVYISLACKDYI